ncbi:hypothetical protein EVS84_11390 [Pseudomonas koreensis]|uniref:Uncharacterized protein n=1 Tax=Pseudomonas koreensis TaxID=198620 RepID=A0A4Q4L431_9PSED|nr:hypothetical protein EVS84_11390 [Pseudomonas koreensis]
MCWRLREQARSHRDFGWDGDRWCAPDHCGSELARESGVSFNVDVSDLAPSRASPLPQGFEFD